MNKSKQAKHSEEPHEYIAYPLHFKGELTEPLSRWLWLVKLFLLMPHYIVLCFLWLAFAVVWIIAIFAILFTGKYPRGLFEFNVGVLRWTWRVWFYGYQALGTDKYPPFTLKAGGYPADLKVAYPEKLSRGLVLIKWWLLAIPHYLIVVFFGGSIGIPPYGGLVSLLTIVAGVVLLFRGRYPKDILQYAMNMNRWIFRVAIYTSLMTDLYPPFRLGRKKDIKTRIEEIKGEINCPQNYKCIESGYENLCKTQDIRTEPYIECLDEHPDKCSFSIRFGSSYWCKCPLRIYIAEELML